MLDRLITTHDKATLRVPSGLDFLYEQHANCFTPDVDASALFVSSLQS
jgi:hypothetical protein